MLIWVFLLTLMMNAATSKGVATSKGAKVHLTTCETRADDVRRWENMATNINAKAGAMRMNVTNVCEGLKWEGTIMKPLVLIEYIKKQIANGASTKEIIIFTDGSDTVLNFESSDQIVHRYKSFAKDK
jgi:hypothetical protein